MMTLKDALLPALPLSLKSHHLMPHERLDDLTILLHGLDLRHWRYGHRYSSFYNEDEFLKEQSPELYKKKQDLLLSPEYKETLAEALNAVKAGEIEMLHGRNDGEESPSTIVKTISFFLWATSGGRIVPKNFEDLMEFAFFSEQQELNAKAKEQTSFPLLTKEEFEKRKNQSLWFIYDALLYCAGHDNKSKDVAYIARYLEKFDFTKPTLDELDNAILVKRLEIFDNQVNPTLTEFEGRLARKVKPQPFIDLLQSVTKVPFLEEELQNTLEPSLTGVYATPELTLLIDAARKFWSDFDPNAPNKSRVVKKSVTDWLIVEAKKRGFDLSETLADKMDTIIRPLSARQGGNLSTG